MKTSGTITAIQIRKALDMSKRSKKQIELPAPAEEGTIDQTTIYPTIEAMWLEAIVDKPWFDATSFEAKQVLRYVLYTAVSEMLRTVAFRINADQDTRVFDELGKEILAYDRTLQAYSAGLNVNGHGN